MRHGIQSVRVRATLGASAVVLVALVLAGVALTAALHDSQLSSIDQTLEVRANDIASLLDGGATPASVAVENDKDGFVQILDGSSNVVAASENIGDAPAVAGPLPERNTSRDIGALGGDTFRIRVQTTDRARPFTIVIGTTLEDLERNQHVLIGALSTGLPILLGIIATLVWVVVGRALHPVEAIRSRVAEIGGGQLDQRIAPTGTRDEIGRLADTMNEMLDRLEESQARQARFVSDASHELRTPIAVIRHELEVALRTEGTEHWPGVASDVLEEDLRMQRLVDDLLFIARHERPNAQPNERALVDLDDLVLAEVRRGHLAKPVDVSGLSAGQVRGDADQLSRVVRNLLDNAVRHATSRVAVQVHSADRTVVLDVDDDGPGVAPGDREIIFGRFTRSDDARSRATGGAGLGLAMVRDIVTEHGGAVDVRRSPGLGGARFTVCLPDARV